MFNGCFYYYVPGHNAMFSIKGKRPPKVPKIFRANAVYCRETIAGRSWWVIMNEKTWPSPGQAGSVSLNNCHTSLPSTEPSQAQPSPCNLLNWRVTLSAQCEATERERETWCSNCCFYYKCTTVVRNCYNLESVPTSTYIVVLQLRVTLLPVIQMSREQRRQGAVFQRDSAPATQHTISVSR